MLKVSEFPQPKSLWGYTTDQLDEIFSEPTERAAFDEWFYGQTGVIDDDGRMVIYDHDVRRYVESWWSGQPSVWD